MQPDDIDKLFREGLRGHRTTPPRALWERLEDELHPPKARKRAVAWWPMALAASLVLLVLAGGGLWNGWLRPGRGPELAGASQPASPDAGAKAAPATPARTAAGPAPGVSRPNASAGPAVAAGPAKPREARRETPAAAAKTARQPVVAQVETAAAKSDGNAVRGGQSAKNGLAPRLRATSRPVAEVAATSLKKIPARQATRPAPTASTPLNAGLGVRQPEKPLPTTLAPEPQPAASIVVATATTTPATPSALASPAAVIEVDVRRGGGPALARLAGALVPTMSPAEATASPGRRRFGGRLGRQFDGVLGQADRVVRTARQSLNSLPNVTVEAHLGERTVSKTLML